jgi:hypothetical protein
MVFKNTYVVVGIDGFSSNSSSEVTTYRCTINGETFYLTAFRDFHTNDVAWSRTDVTIFFDGVGYTLPQLVRIAGPMVAGQRVVVGASEVAAFRQMVGELYWNELMSLKPPQPINVPSRYRSSYNEPERIS